MLNIGFAHIGANRAAGIDRYGDLEANPPANPLPAAQRIVARTQGAGDRGRRPERRLRAVTSRLRRTDRGFGQKDCRMASLGLGDCSLQRAGDQTGVVMRGIKVLWRLANKALEGRLGDFKTA